MAVNKDGVPEVLRKVIVIDSGDGPGQPVILRAVPQPERPWAQRMPVQVCGASKTTRLQPCRPSRRIPPPRLFPNL